VRSQGDSAAVLHCAHGNSCTLRRAAHGASRRVFPAQGRGQMSKVKLMKLLYLAERESCRRYGEPISGDTLLSTPGGPVLSTTQDLMAGVDRTDIHAAFPEYPLSCRFSDQNW